MGKYLLLWKLDHSKLPVGRKERAAGWDPMLDLVKQDLENGSLKDWGEFVGEHSGYAVAEGTEVEVHSMVQKWVPFVIFEVRPILSVHQATQTVKDLAK